MHRKAYTCCILLDSEDKKPLSRAEFVRLPYIWALPYEVRDTITFSYCAIEAIQYAFAFATCPNTLKAFEEYGLKIRNTPCGYDNLIGAAAYMPNSTTLVSCLPTRKDMNAFGRTMRFISRRIFDRVLRPRTYAKTIPLDHTIIRKGTQNFYKDELTSSNPLFIAIDLETAREMLVSKPGEFQSKQDFLDAASKVIHKSLPNTSPILRFGALITIAGYTFVYADKSQPTGLRYKTYTQSFKSKEDYDLLTAICAMPQAKVMHNGKYDMHYFARWRIPVVNYCFDTLYYLKSVSANIKKKVRGKGAKGFYSLQAAANFYCMESTYWKDGRESSGDAKHRYCAMDCHKTALIAQQQLRMGSNYAMQNFLMTHWRLPVCIVMGMRGLRILEEEREKLKNIFTEELSQLEDEVQKLFGCSANQSAKLLPAFKAMAALALKCKLPGAKNVDSTGKNIIRDLSELHPLFARLLKPVTEARNRQKWLATYIMKKGMNRNDFNGGYGIEGDFFVYDLDPFGTASRRLASSKSAYWTGGNGQQIPSKLRVMYGTLPGYYLAASDGSAAETRTTAYLSKCETMKLAVEGDQDFHSLNSAFFFGIPYNQIYDDKSRKTINKGIRDLGKKINHAANYMMGAGVFVENAGASICFRMKELRNLPDNWTLKQVAAFMLRKFDERFPEVRGSWANEQAFEVLRTGMLQCFTGYKPLILESPTQSKSCLNECVALESQHFAAQINLDITHELWLAEIRTGGAVLPLMQIHDENLFAVRKYFILEKRKGDNYELIGTQSLNAIYQECADRSIDMKFVWSDGSPAILKIPADDPIVGHNWLDVKS